MQYPLKRTFKEEGARGQVKGERENGEGAENCERKGHIDEAIQEQKGVHTLTTCSHSHTKAQVTSGVTVTPDGSSYGEHQTMEK